MGAEEDPWMPLNRAKFHFDNLYSERDRVFGPYILYQIGDLSCEPGYQTYEHEQTVYEISYVLSGSGQFFVDGTPFEVEKDDLFLSKKTGTHNVVSSENDPLRYFYLGFDFVEPLKNDQFVQLKAFFDTNETFKIPNASGIQDSFMKLLSEFLAKDFLSPMLVEAYMQEIICAVYRTFQKKVYRSYLLNSPNNSDEKLVYDVIHYIDVNLESMEGLTELSREFGYSYTHIAQKFSALTGESLKAYHTKRRFEKANEYLREGYSVTKIAERLGFKSIHAFSRAYKKYVGVAPRENKKRAETARAAASSEKSL